MLKPIKSILVLCTGNSARSQIAEGLLRHYCHGRITVASAGLRPSQVRPEAITAMAEVGIDISAQRSKSLEEFRGREFDLLITVCDHAQQSCPMFLSARERMHWSIPDPVTLEDFRTTRDLLTRHIQLLLLSAGAVAAGATLPT